MSKPDKKSKIPEAPVPLGCPGGSGNLLSSVAPPSALPNFMTASPAPVKIISQETPQPVLIPTPVSNIDTPQTHNVESQQPRPENFSPAIPLSKGEPLQSIRSPEDSQATQSPESLPSSTSEMDALGDIMPGSGLLTWVKGAVSTGGLLHRVAEKAKSSVDSMITTLDPQMKEYLNSGGDIYVVVASDKDVKISPIREAFQAVFLKATVIGCAAQSSVTAAQPVGYAAAYAAAKQRLAHVRSTRADVTNDVPLVAVESFIAEAIPDRWYEQSLLVLSRPSLALELHSLSQGCALPAAAAAAASAATPADYPHAATGYSLPVGAVMADSLQVPRAQWQEACTGVSRRETLALAARALAGAYKRQLAISAAEA